MKKLLIPAVLLCAMAFLPLAGRALGTAMPSQTVTILERHVYSDGESQLLIPQNGAEKRHILVKGTPLTLKSGQFPGFKLETKESERHVLAQTDETVVFRYVRTVAPVTATIQVDTTSVSNLAFLRERLASRSISLRTRQETLLSQPLTFPDSAGKELSATLTFAPVYTHSLGGSPLSYRVLMENLPEGFMATTDGLTLQLRPVSFTLTIEHLFESAKGMEPIPQSGAAYEIECQYGDTLLIPNQDFEGFLTDQETPNQYIAAVTGELELHFFHRRRMGVYGQIQIDATRSNRPTRLLRLVEKENPVVLSLDGKMEGSAVAQFSGKESITSVSFPNAYTHTPEGAPLSYTLSLVETPDGFLAHGEGTAIVLTPRPVSIHVSHQYAEAPGVWQTIPQEGASYMLPAFFGDTMTISAKAFAGFAEEPGDERMLSQVTGEEEVFFQHVRALGNLGCTLRLEGGPDSNYEALMSELVMAYFTAGGGELPEEGMRVPTVLAGEETAYTLQATLPGVPTHTPDGRPYAYSLTLRGFSPLAGVLQPFTDVRANVPVLADLGLPEVSVTCLLQYTENGTVHSLAQQAGSLAFSYPYGETVTIAPPEVPGFSTEDQPLLIPFLKEAVTHTFQYQRTAALSAE